MARRSDRCLSCNAKMQWIRGDFDGVFQSPTSIELAVSDALDAYNIEHVSQYRPPNYNRVYDEFVPPSTLIEVHGDYWHGLKENQERDEIKARWAQENGFALIIIWEHEIKEHGAMALVKERILKEMNTRDCGAVKRSAVH